MSRVCVAHLNTQNICNSKLIHKARNKREINEEKQNCYIFRSRINYIDKMQQIKITFRNFEINIHTIQMNTIEMNKLIRMKG